MIAGCEKFVNRLASRCFALCFVWQRVPSSHSCSCATPGRELSLVYRAKRTKSRLFPTFDPRSHCDFVVSRRGEERNARKAGDTEREKTRTRLRFLSCPRRRRTFAHLKYVCRDMHVKTLCEMDDAGCYVVHRCLKSAMDETLNGAGLLLFAQIVYVRDQQK